MGLDKIVGALRDPENMAFHPEADIVDASSAEDSEEGLQGNMGKRNVPGDDGRNREVIHKKLKN